MTQVLERPARVRPETEADYDHDADADATTSVPGKMATNSTESAAPLHLSDDAIVDLVKVFKLLADETRLRILFYLTQQPEFHVRALCELLGQSQPAVSHHLALLRVAGLIECRREGKHNFYHVLPDRVQQLLDLVFADVPAEKRRLRFESYVLAFAPPTR